MTVQSYNHPSWAVQSTVWNKHRTHRMFLCQNKHSLLYCGLFI